eukprot:1878088-Pleurochrysis_carterae.AAC.1
MLCVLLRALERHGVELPAPGPSQKDQAIDLLLGITKKKRLRASESNERGGPIDLDGDASSDISLTSAATRRQKQGSRTAGRRGKGNNACAAADARGAVGSELE